MSDLHTEFPRLIRALLKRNGVIHQDQYGDPRVLLELELGDYHLHSFDGNVCATLPADTILDLRDPIWDDESGGPIADDEILAHYAHEMRRHLILEELSNL